VTVDDRSLAGGAGAPEGFAQFVAMRSPALLATAWLLTGDHGRAEDLVQEALARAWLAWPRIERQGSVESYVRQTMVHLNISWWRRRWRGEMPSDTMPEPSPGADPMQSADLRHAVGRALADLTPRQRAVIVLRYFEDWTEARTASALGCSVGTVKSQASRAVAALRGHPDIHALLVRPELLRGER
jgi:RNA polymerase sigma-70 factor (sigma-E family)